jgi:acetyl esterase
VEQEIWFRRQLKRNSSATIVKDEGIFQVITGIRTILQVILIAAVALCTAAVLLPTWLANRKGLLEIKIALFLKYLNFIIGGPPLDQGACIEEVRRTSQKRGILRYAPTPVAHVGTQSIHGPGGPFRIRLYHPQPDEILPVVIYYHGGGWIMGDLDSHDNICRSIAARAQVVVVSPDYRLAPEHEFPAAFEDAYAALLWARQNAALIGGDPLSLAVAGDSSGGNLAAAVALKARDGREHPISCQILIYPVLNLGSFDTASYRDFGAGFFLTHASMLKFREMYVPDSSRWHDPYVSPAKAGDLSGLPPAYIITAEVDVLRDEGEAYAARLLETGVPVVLRRYNKVIHGFLGMERLTKKAFYALDDMASFLKQHFGHCGDRS